MERDVGMRDAYPWVSKPELGESWPCGSCGLMVTDGHICKARERDAMKCEYCGLMITVDGSHRCKKQPKPKRIKRTEPLKIKMLSPKEEMTFMDIRGSIDSTHYEEVTVEKNPWKCMECGLVWQTKHEAEECEGRKHAESYTKRYGVRYVENGRPVGGYEVTFKAIRKEEIYPGCVDCGEPVGKHVTNCRWYI